MENLLCPNCGSTEYTCQGYDVMDFTRLSDLFIRISQIEWRIMKLEKQLKIEEEDPDLDDDEVVDVSIN